MDPERLKAADLIAAGTPFRIFHTIQAEPYPLHWHDFYEMALILRGSGWQVINGNRHSLRPGTLFLLTPVDFHHILPQPDEPLELYNLIFVGQFLDAELRQWLFTGQTYHHFDLPGDLLARVSPEFEQIWTESGVEWPGRSRIMRSALEKILLEVARHAQGGKPLESSGHSAIHNALLYVHHHFRSALTLAEVAAQAKMAPTYFSRAFHQATGTQFQKYLAELRLRFAASLLRTDPRLPITEICFASGFGNMANFGRAFHAKYGIAPRQYRKTT